MEQVAGARDGDGAEGRPESLLAGRATQLAVVSGLAVALLRGRGGVLWVEGETGMGKTALVDALAAQAERGGATVLRSAGDELMEDFPLRLMAACLGVDRGSGDPARAEIASLLRGGVSSGPRRVSDGNDVMDATYLPGGAADPLLMAQARMLALADRLAAKGPVLLVAEDLHWSDEASLRVWSSLARATKQMPLLLVGTARSAPGRVAVERLRLLARAWCLESGPRRWCTVVGLPPLVDADVARLAAAVAGAEPGPRLRTELARAGGNPLYVRTLVEALFADGLVTVDPAAANGAKPAPARGCAEFTGQAGATPDALADMLGWRLGTLPGEVLSVLRLAALLGTRFDPEQLAAVAGAGPESVSAALGAAERAGVVCAGARPAFSNELIRQVLTWQIPVNVRRTLHNHIARTLVGLDASADDVIRHLHAAGTGLQPWAVDWLAQVPNSALGGMPSVSAPLLREAMAVAERAAEPTAAGGLRWQALAKRLACVLYLKGEDEEVIEVAWDLARKVGDGELAASMTELAVRAVLRTGRWRQTVDLVREALPGADVSPMWRSRLRSLSSLALSQLGEDEQARTSAAAALAEARASGDSLTTALAHHAVSVSSPLAAAIEHNARALALLGDDPESADLRIVLSTNRMIWLDELGDLEKYHGLVDQVLLLSERFGTMRTGMVRLRAAMVDHLRGDWDGAMVLLDDLDTEQLPPPELVRAHSLRVMIHVHRAEREPAARALAAAEGAAAGMPEADPFYGPLVEARAAAAEANGDPDRALSLLAAPFYASRADVVVSYAEVSALVRLALVAGERALAVAVTESLERKAAQEKSPRRAVIVRWCRGQVDDDAAGLLAVARTMDEASWPFDAAGAYVDAAVRLAAGGSGQALDTERARAALTSAVGLYSGMGAEWDIRRADARLRAYGVRRGPRSAHRRENTGWGALTAGERRIAQLVGQGWSNPDIATELVLSRHTVETHVSNILGKLQLGSRSEVVRAVAKNMPRK